MAEDVVEEVVSHSLQKELAEDNDFSVKVALDFKEQGNDLFRQRLYDQAIQLYSK